MGEGDGSNSLNCFGEKSRKRKTGDVDDYIIPQPIVQYDPEVVRLSLNKVSYKKIFDIIYWQLNVVKS